MKSNGYAEEQQLPPEAMHLAVILARIDELERLDEKQGATAARLRERNALEWALNRLASFDPRIAKILPRAVARAEERIRNSGWKP